MATKAHLACPHCGQLDAVHKVSALHAQGPGQTSSAAPAAATQTSVGTPGATATRPADSGPALAERLAPPAKPNLRRPSPRSWDQPVALWTGLLLVGIATLVLGLGGVVARDVFRDIPFPWLDVAAGVMLIGLSLPRIRQGRARLQQRCSEELEQYTTTISQWEMALHQWESAYYCGRCAGVFVPESGQFTPIDQWVEARSHT